MNNNGSSPLEFLEWLTQCIERAGIDIAPGYEDYINLTFAIANDCGEAGRPFFHRITCLSGNYKAEENDKHFSHALKSGRRGNSLGTVYHLAETCGVELKGDGWKADWNDYKFSSKLPLPYTISPRVRIEKKSNNAPCFEENISKKEGTDDSNLIPKDIEKQNQLQVPASFKPYAWPRFLQRCTDCGETVSQADAIWLASLSVLGATVAPLVRFNYSHKTYFTSILLFIVGSSAAGKGVISWPYQLGEPLQKRFRTAFKKALGEYNMKYNEWSNLGKAKASVPQPERPPMQLFYISGNNTGTGILENLIDSKGIGCIFAQEADEVSSAISSEYGHFSDMLRKAYDHEGLSFNRRTNKEYREVDSTYLTMVMSGTPGQVEPLIPSPENGLFSRMLFYYMPSSDRWKSRFSEGGEDYGNLFLQWGYRWDAVMNRIRSAASEVVFRLSREQQEEFDECLASIFSHGNLVHGSSGRSTVARIGINLLRMMATVAWIRSLDDWLMEESEDTEKSATQRLLACPGIAPDPSVAEENVKDGVISRFRLSITEEDFQEILSMADIIYRHAAYIMAILPKDHETTNTLTPKDRFMNDLPIEFYRQEVLEMAKEYGLSEGMMDKLIGKMLKDGVLVKIEPGHYRFNSDYKK